MSQDYWREFKRLSGQTHLNPFVAKQRDPRGLLLSLFIGTVSFLGLLGILASHVIADARPETSSVCESQIWTHAALEEPGHYLCTEIASLWARDLQLPGDEKVRTWRCLEENPDRLFSQNAGVEGVPSTAPHTDTEAWYLLSQLPRTLPPDCPHCLNRDTIY